MVIEQFITFLNTEYGLKIDPKYYTNIREWKEWWEGNVNSFHEYTELGLNGVRQKRALFRLPMAKKACEDWASILIDEETQITAGDANSNRLLQDEMKRLNFLTNSQNLVELAMRSGTAAYVVGVDNLTVTGSGKIIPSKDARIFIDYLPAECIIPLTVKHGHITEAAFVSEVINGGRSEVYLQMHTLNPDGTYHILNRYYTSASSSIDDEPAYKEAPMPNSMAADIDTGSNIPWFAVFTPAVLKNTQIHSGAGLGMAIYANAEDCLKNVDTAFNNYHRDLFLGGKKLFYSKKLTQEVIDDDGNSHMIAPDDVQQQLFWTQGTDDPDTQPWIHEYNPALRVDEDRLAVQDAMNYLSMACGLGGHHWTFEHDSVTTATQYAGDRQELVANASKHHCKLADSFVSVCRAILYANVLAGGAQADPETNIDIVWGNAYETSAEEKRAQMKQDCADGFIPKYKYVAKYYGMGEEDAKEAVKQAEAESLELTVSPE